GETAAWSLEIGEEGPAPAAALQIEETNAGVEIDTGALRFRLGGTGLLTSVQRRSAQGWTPLPDSDLVLYLTDGKGQRFDSTILPVRIQIEELGPLRACLCLRGEHANADGLPCCPFILRIHVFAGRSDLRLQHTFIFDQDPACVQLGSIGIELGAPLRERDCKVSIATDQHVLLGAEEVAVLQRDDQSCDTWQDGEQGTAGRTQGWARCSTKDGSVLAALTEPWREFPKGLRASAEGLDVQIWPAAAGPLSFSTPFREMAIRFDATRDEQEVIRRLQQNPTAPLNLKSFDVQSPADLEWVEQVVARHAPERAASHNDTGTDDGRGAAKTTDIWLRFEIEPVDDAAASQWAMAAQEPLLAPADPAYACATEAYGHFYQAGDDCYEAVDAGLDQIFASVAMEPQQRARLYGMMRYGNAVCSHSAGPAVAWRHYKDTDPVRALQHVGPYNNETNDQILSAWGNYLRTARREHFRFPRAYGRCVADVATIHAHPDANRVGLMHYHNAHQWTGGPSPSHTMIGGTLIDYYLTGDRRQLEVAREVADWAVRTQEPAGIVSCRNGALHREYTGPVMGLVEAYQATWEERYGLLAERSLNWFLHALTTPGHYPVSIYTRGNRGDEAVIEPMTPPVGHARDLYPLFEAALRLFPSQRLRRHILAEADYYVWEHLTDSHLTAEMARSRLTDRSRMWKVDDEFYWTQWGASGDGGAQIACLAYDLTQDPVYAAYCDDQLLGSFARQAERCRHHADWRFTWLCFGISIPRLMATVSKARARDAAALEAALQAWKARRRELGCPVYEGPGVDLCVDSMDVNGNILSRDPDDIPREAPPRPREPVIDLGRLPVVAS
ncbi:MAG: hypothetical protein HOH74_17220, partial [Gemmatimonadetes bacterium]|nr:hypothetical protein [Gemmatimonadota bacterium]